MSDLQALLALWTAGLAHNNLREPRVPTLSHTHSALAPNLHCIGWKGGKKCRPDRKSTRLNSSHLVISYAVFCLKKDPPQGHASPADLASTGLRSRQSFYGTH